MKERWDILKVPPPLAVSELLQSVARVLQRGDGQDDRWPDAKGEYWSLCPYHNDSKTGSFSVSERGYRCFSCGAKGGLPGLAKHLGLGVLQSCSQTEGISHIYISLTGYAKAKHLDADFLRSVGVSERKWGGNPALRMAYLDQDGQESAVRYRIAMTGTDRFRWSKGGHVMPYGLWRLPDAKQHGYIYLVEGESDTQTLWTHGFPALGIPGADTWKPAWASYLDGLTVYVWQEPDRGGVTLARGVGQALPDARVMSPPPGRKDVSECHLLGDDIPAVLERMRAAARPYREVRAEAESQAAAAAKVRAAALLQMPDILGAFSDLCEVRGLVGEGRTAKILYLALTSRLLERPISVAVKGPSSGGKSYVVEKTLDAFPETAYLDFTSMSEHALVYDDRPVSHRFIVLYEASGLGDERPGETNTLAYMLRSLLSEGRLKYLTVEKTEDGLQPRMIERQGPTGLILTTTWATLHQENETRLLSVTVRDDAKQTRGIFESLADRANGDWPKDPDMGAWHALQTWLQLAGCREVTIPYAHNLARLTSDRAVRLRRDFGAILGLISTHAILHQCQRDRDALGWIVATIDDYRAVYDLVLDLVSESVQATVSKTIRETVRAVHDLTQGEDAVTLSKLAARLGLDKSSTSRRVRVAIEAGYLTNLQEKRGRPARLAIGEAMPEEQPVLPAPEKICVLDPLCNTATLQHPDASQDDLPDVCSECGAPVAVYDAAGRGWCERHGREW